MSYQPHASIPPPATLRRYGSQYCLTVRKTAYHDPSTSLVDHDDTEPYSSSDDKLAQSISRTRSRIFELAACNPWEYFVTLTLDPARYDRYNLAAFRRDLAQWIRNQRRLHGCAFSYLLIPEMHADGAWHMHGLVSGLRTETFEFNSNGYLDYPPYRERFGFISLSPVRCLAAVSRYVTKYVSKDLAARGKELGAHLFYASRGLAQAEIVDRGDFHPPQDIVPSFENKWVWTLWLDSPVELEKPFDGMTAFPHEEYIYMKCERDPPRFV